MPVISGSPPRSHAPHPDSGHLDVRPAALGQAGSLAQGVLNGT
jgi:hypothetical protein